MSELLRKRERGLGGCSLGVKGRKGTFTCGFWGSVAPCQSRVRALQ